MCCREDLPVRSDISVINITRMYAETCCRKDLIICLDVLVVNSTYLYAKVLKRQSLRFFIFHHGFDKMFVDLVAYTHRDRSSGIYT